MTITPALRQAVYSAFGGRCFYSGRKINLDDAHVDHVFPQAKGGSDDYANLVLCASDINVSKQDCEINATALRPLLEGVYAPRIAKHMDREAQRIAKRKEQEEARRLCRDQQRSATRARCIEPVLPCKSRDMHYVDFARQHPECVTLNHGHTQGCIRTAICGALKLVNATHGDRNWEDGECVVLKNVPYDMHCTLVHFFVSISIRCANGSWHRSVAPGESGWGEAWNYVTVSPYAMRIYLEFLDLLEA